MALSFAAGNYSGDISYRVLVKFLAETLISMRWLKLYKGYQTKAFSRRSRIGLNKPLCDWLAELTIDPDDIDYRAPQSCLVLKDIKKKIIKVPAEMKERALELEASTHRINANLERTFTNLFIDEYELEDLNTRMANKGDEEPVQQFKHSHPSALCRAPTSMFNGRSLRLWKADKGLQAHNKDNSNDHDQC